MMFCEPGGCAGGRVQFVNVMALENLAAVFVLQGSGRGASDVVEKVHANGEVSGIDESVLCVLDQRADAVDSLYQPVVPTIMFLPAFTRLRRWPGRNAGR